MKIDDDDKIIHLLNNNGLCERLNKFKNGIDTLLDKNMNSDAEAL